MKFIYLLAVSIGLHTYATAQDKVPFDGMDLSWMNGQNRQKDFPLVVKDKENSTIITGVALFDTYINYDFSNPIDHTHNASATIGRNNEFTVNMASIGLEANYKNVIGRIYLQSGAMLNLMQDQDASVLRGNNNAISNLKNIREAAAGYHFNKWYGVNIEVGILPSFIGTESYNTQENWCYQRAMISEFTPYYFSGARLQVYPSKNFKTELWLVNGWQSYNAWNNRLGIGNSNYYRPNENTQLVANFYVGKDNKIGNTRFHHDNSISYRYKHTSKGLISQAAVCLNTHYGFEGKNNVIGAALSHRLWFKNNKLAWTLRVDALKNKGAYLAIAPCTQEINPYNIALSAMNTPSLNVGQLTSTFDIMPNDFYTLRVEYAYRKSNVPYFAGRGGTTSPDGWQNTPVVGNWMPDLQKNNHSIRVAVNFRL